MGWDCVQCINTLDILGCEHMSKIGHVSIS